MERKGVVQGLFLLAVSVVLEAILAHGVDARTDQLNIWPMPKSVSHGQDKLYLAKEFGLKTDGSKYTDPSRILRDGFSRFLAILSPDHVVDANFSTLDHSPVLHGIHVVVISPSDELQYGIDESYNLTIPGHGKALYADLQARTVYGALHGLQTFSQLCHFNHQTRVLVVAKVPWTIFDEPRFPFRGLLIDTSRHYQPLPVIRKVIDSMVYAKLNVLHWHIVDIQSFPLEIPSYPKLWDGAYSYTERYTMSDAAEIVSYAQRRGISVLAELDVPGHALSWGIGYPSLWPSTHCQQPLDVSNEFTFKVINGILSDFSKIFKFKFVHLGGDEVDTSCWRLTPRINKWLQTHNMSESDAYQYFVLRAQKIALSLGYEIVNWEETFNKFGSKLNPKTVVHNWLDGGVAQKVVAVGLRCIVSNQYTWYLDHLDLTWQQFYSNEPLGNITIPAHQKLVIGGEVCMWGETVDGSDIEQTIWPRAAAAAERLWTSYDKLPTDPKHVIGRLAHFRCLLLRRGVAAAPVTGLGRTAPDEPGSCYMQ